MSIPNPSDWSSACVRKNIKFNRSSTCRPLLLFLTPLSSSSSSRILILNSSGSCPSPPILEDESTDQSPELELELKVQDYQDPPLPDSENVNDFIFNLLKDPRTAEMGYECYQKVKTMPDFRLKRSTVHQLIRYSLRSKNWNSIWSISDDFRRFKVYPDASSCTKLVSSCIRNRRFKLVNHLLQILKFEKEVALSSFNSAMKSYNKLHMYSATVSVFEILKSSGIQLDDESYGRAMEGYLKMGKNEKLVSLFKEFESSKVEGTSFCTQIYRILCESMGKSKRPFEALDYFREMTKKGFPEDPSFYSLLISSFASIREVKWAETLLEEAIGKKMMRDPAVFLQLVLMYIQVGSVEKTLDVVSCMQQVNIRVSDCIFVAVVNAFAKKRGVSSAVKVYEDLVVSEGCEPGQVTYASVLNLYWRIGLYEKAEEVFQIMDNKGFDKCVVAYASMIAMYGKTNRIRDAMRLVAKMKEKGVEPNVWIYNSLLDMHGKALNLRQVEKIWKEMKRRNIMPDNVSYTSVINAYSKAREFEICMKYYHEYRLNGGKIDRAMAGIMVGVYSKISRVDELVKLLHDMKAEGTLLDARLYRSSLNALRDAGVQFEPKWLQESFDTKNP